MPLDRPLWFLARGGIPVPASSKKVPADAAWQCYEGDSEWTPVSPSGVRQDVSAGRPAGRRAE